jgi:hypothetical protein
MPNYSASQWASTPNQANGGPFASSAAQMAAQLADINLLHTSCIRQEGATPPSAPDTALDPKKGDPTSL